MSCASAIYGVLIPRERVLVQSPNNKCSRCGQTFKEGDKFCAKCGRELESSKVTNILRMDDGDCHSKEFKSGKNHYFVTCRDESYYKGPIIFGVTISEYEHREDPTKGCLTAEEMAEARETIAALMSQAGLGDLVTADNSFFDKFCIWAQLS